MDITSNKIAAYILDNGKHAEWSRSEGKPICIVRYQNGVITINADTLVFSIGMQTEHGAVELIVGIAPATELIFSLGNADCYSYADMVKIHMPTSSDVAVTKPNSYRMVFKHIFGFDCTTTSIKTMRVPYFERMEDNQSLYITDKQSTRLKDIVYENDSDVSQDMANAGFSFVAARMVVDNIPQPVFWANGNYTHSSTEEDELAFQSINLVVNSYLQTRYLNSLLSPARGFCPHLSV